MPTVLIIDTGKASLVMSSEIFKDKIPGVKVLTAGTAALGLEIAKREKPDLCMVDFDLPDADGVSLIMAMRKFFKNPILLTAYPDPMVEKAVAEHLFAYNDSGGWIPKPVRAEALSQKIDHFLVDGKRVGKRFEVSPLDTMMIAKAAGRGKRAPKFIGVLKTLSLGGACVVSDEAKKLKRNQEVMISIAMPSNARKPKDPNKKPSRTTEKKFKASIAWISKDQVGLQFARLTEVQKQGLEDFLRAWQV